MSATAVPSLQDALAAHRAGDIPRAADMYARIVQADPGNADAHQFLGVAMMQAGRPADAAGHFGKAVEINGENADWWNNFGLARFESGNVQGARECYERALALNPDQSDARNNLGLVLQTFGQYDASIHEFERAIERQPQNPQFIYNKGVSQFRAAKLADARQTFEHAIRINPNFPYSYASLAAVFMREGDFTKAYQACWEALGRDPFHTPTHQLFKSMKWFQGKKDEMHETLRKVCEALPNEPQAHLQYSNQLLEDKLFLAAEAPLRTLIELQPKNAVVHARLATVLAHTKRPDEAETAYARAMELDPENPEVLERYGETLLLGRNFAAATPILKEAHRTNPRRSSVLANLLIAMTEIDDPALGDYVDYENVVTSMVLAPPDGFDSIESFNDALHDEVEKLHAEAPEPDNQSMKGGTQNTDDLFTYDTPMVQTFRGMLRDAVRGFVEALPDDPDDPFLRYKNPNAAVQGAWSTILRGGGSYDGSHVHNEGWLSGVYYVKVPTLDQDRWEAGEGCIQFGAPPDLFVSEKNRTRRVIRPVPGTLVLFPSYYWHGVMPFSGTELRHAIAFDLR